MVKVHIQLLVSCSLVRIALKMMHPANHISVCVFIANSSHVCVHPSVVVLGLCFQIVCECWRVSDLMPYGSGLWTGHVIRFV